MKTMNPQVDFETMQLLYQLKVSLILENKDDEANGIVDETTERYLKQTSKSFSKDKAAL